jgi:nitroreductase
MLRSKPMSDQYPERLTMPIGEAMFSQRSIRRFKPDKISDADLKVILDAASKAPNGGNRQTGRFVVLNDADLIRKFGALYHEAWWAKRRDEGRPWTKRAEIPADAEQSHRSAARLADEIADAPCIVLAFNVGRGGASSVIPAVQNLMLAARALGIGSVPTTLHPTVMERVNELLGVPPDAEFQLCIPLGYPQGRFGPTQRLPTSQTTFFNSWAAPAPWS